MMHPKAFEEFKIKQEESDRRFREETDRRREERHQRHMDDLERHWDKFMRQEGRLTYATACYLAIMVTVLTVAGAWAAWDWFSS